MVGALPHRLDRDVELLDDRDHDDLDRRVVLLGDLQDLEAADAGQADVEHHQVDVLLLHHLKRGFARSLPAAPGNRGRSTAGQRIAHPLVIVDDEDGLAAVRHRGGEYNTRFGER
jgi:hypothetical protein